MTRENNSSKPNIRVAIVDDHAMMREGLRLFLDNTGDMQCVWMAGEAGEAVRQVEGDTPDVLIVDITLPGRSGLELIKDIRLLRPQLPMLAVSMHDEKLYAQRALKAGARGYIMKSAPHKMLGNAIRRILSGGVAVSEEMSDEILKSFVTGGAPSSSSQDGIAELSDREFEVFRLIGAGKNTGQIAELLRISPKTVDVHKLNIRTKMGLSDGTELTFFAIRWAEGQKSR
ncbi:MAG: response regulator transcription factor [Prosthecobacter sp.]